MRCGWVVLWLVLLAGCGGARKAVRLETGQGPSGRYVPRMGHAPVELGADAFEEVAATLGQEVRPSRRPLESARRQFNRPSVRVVSHAAPGGPTELTRAYLRWCERTLRPGDCLRLLEEGPLLSGDGRYALAMAIAQGSVLGETREAFRKMADPEAVVAMVVSTATVYMMLWALPEPVSKAVAATLTVALMGYLGYETVWGLISGWLRLVDAVDRATTFDEIRVAGERYGQVMGERAARIFLMLATAAVGRTGPELAARLPSLPGAGLVALRAEAQLGVRYGAVAGVHAVAVSAEGLTIALAPGAVAMAARDSGSSGAHGQPPPSGGPGEWVEVNESMSESARRYQAQVTGAPEGHAYRVKAGGEEVNFDGYKDGVLLEAKGPHYEQFIDKKLDPLGFFKGTPKLLKQAERQFEAAGGTPIRWLVAEKKFAAALRKLFVDNEISIEVVHMPPLP
jgi:hypothetical protein